MTFTWVPQTSTAKMAFRDSRFAGARVADGFFIDGYLSRRCDRRFRWNSRKDTHPLPLGCDADENFRCCEHGKSDALNDAIV